MKRLLAVTLPLALAGCFSSGANDVYPCGDGGCCNASGAPVACPAGSSGSSAASGPTGSSTTGGPSTAGSSSSTSAGSSGSHSSSGGSSGGTSTGAATSSEGTSGGSSTGSGGSGVGGSPCGNDFQCASGQCLGQLCCSETCATADPACGAQGCSDAGACLYPAAGTACGANPVCGQSNLFQPGGACDGFGNCVPGASGQCPGGLLCNAAGTGCDANCQTDADCVPGDWCNAGQCIARSNDGSQCSQDDGCVSGVCEGVCCAVDCSTAGFGCFESPCLAGSGVCSVKGTGSSCTEYPASCVGSTYTPGSQCGGMGDCRPGAPAPCANNFACAGDSGVCNTACTVDGDCASGYDCSLNQCLPALGAGLDCSTAVPCAGGLECLGGFCCAAPCVDAGPCAATACTSGSGACNYPVSDCVLPSCSNGVLTNPAACSDGTCPVPTTTSCSPYVCGAGADCATACFGQSDCAAGFTCCGGACVDTQTDDGNCGLCGLACSAVSPSTTPGCIRGQCFVTLASSPAPWGIAVNGGTVYWTNNPGGTDLESVPAVGGTPTVLFADGGGAFAVAFDATSLYWTESHTGSVMKLPFAGGQPQLLLAGPPLSMPTALAVAGDNLFLAFNGTGLIGRLSVDGGSLFDLTPPVGGGYYTVAVDATYVYYGQGSGTDGGTLTAVLMDGGSPVVIASGEGPIRSLLASGGFLYWSSDTVGGAVFSSPTPTFAPHVLATQQSQPRAAATDGTFLYWLDGSGNLERDPVGGGAPTLLATGLGSVEFVAIDASSVYWTQDDGNVMKLTPR